MFFKLSKKTLLTLMSTTCLGILLLLLTACGGTTTAPTPTPEPPTATATPIPTSTATPEPTATSVSTATPTPDPAVEAAFAAEAVLKLVFKAAQTQKFDSLQYLCDPYKQNDSDTEMICNLATDETNREMFIELFANGKINGKAKLAPDGGAAAIPFLFGPSGDQSETMQMIQRDGEWYLFSF